MSIERGVRVVPTASETSEVEIRADGVEQFSLMLEASMGSPFFRGNTIEILRNGDEIFPAMLDAIRQARTRIDFLTFVYWRGNIARLFAEAMSEAARRGVRVRVLLDGVGALPMDGGLVDNMKESGVDVRWFRPVGQWLAPWKITHRTHRKVLVCDGQVGFTGGVGIAAEWEGNARNPNEWRDTQFRVRGPAVRGLEAAFLGNWIEVAPLGTPTCAQVTDCPAPGSCRIQVVRSTAAVQWSDMATLVRTLISMASSSLRVSTPYFVPDDDTVDALCNAARRGVHVEIIVPGPHVDHRVVQIAGEGSYEKMLESGVRIWEYQPTLIHQKIMAVDDAIVSIGSGNLNQRSLLQDDEVQLVVLDTDFASSIADMLDADRNCSEEVRVGQWVRRGWLRRSIETVAKLFRRQM